MSSTLLAQVDDQIQTFWSPLMTKQLRESLLLGALVDKKYQGELKAMGDTVRVSQVNAPTGQLLSVGAGADSFSSDALSTSYVDIVANKRAVASYEFEDLVDLQSIIGGARPDVMEALNHALAKQINDHLYSLVSPSTSAPDHSIASVTDFNASQLAAARLLAAQAKWRSEPGWYCLADPSYYSDLMNAATLTSSDYGAQDAPVVSGQIALRRFGFNILEDNSRSADQALLFHPDFMHLVMQQQVRTKVSDLHPNKRFGYVLSVDVVFGAKLGIDGDVKHIKVYNS